jgi:hypothetical protein
LGRSLRKIVVTACLLALAASATAYALMIEIGPLWVSATATMQPRELPKRGNAPITLSTVTRVGTHDGSTPPILKNLLFYFDKHGTIDTRGLARCTEAKLAGTTTKQARQRCAKALVGTGTVKTLVAMPGKAPFTMTSALSLFNGPPTGGNPTLIAHGYETVPTPQALLVTIPIEKVSHGRYGFRAEVELPEIAGGFGHPLLAEATVGATRKRAGKNVGYINAHCSGGRLQIYGTVTFTNGDHFPTTLTSPCHFPR